MQCDNDIHACYVIDNNGYIILSNDSDDTGRFFGEVEAYTMHTLVELEIFKAITVYDYQAVCKALKGGHSTSSFATIFSTASNPFYLKDKLLRTLFAIFLQPFQMLKSYLQWIITETIISMASMNLWAKAEIRKSYEI